MDVQTLNAPPPGCLLAELAAREPAFTDAYALQLPHPVPLADFVLAFYTSPLFKLERRVLALFGAPSRDEQAQALAGGQGERFAVWTVQARRDGELLLTERSGVTSSWLSVQGGQLRFGSAFRPRTGTRGRHADGRPRFGLLFHLLLGLHRAYSRALLRAAARRLGY